MVITVGERLPRSVCTSEVVGVDGRTLSIGELISDRPSVLLFVRHLDASGAAKMLVFSRHDSAS